MFFILFYEFSSILVMLRYGHVLILSFKPFLRGLSLFQDPGLGNFYGILH